MKAGKRGREHQLTVNERKRSGAAGTHVQRADERKQHTDRHGRADRRAAIREQGYFA